MNKLSGLDLKIERTRFRMPDSEIYQGFSQNELTTSTLVFLKFKVSIYFFRSWQASYLEIVVSIS